MSGILGSIALLCLVGTTVAAALPMMRDPILSHRAAWKWKRSTYDADPDFYNERGKKCKNCPAGYYVKVDCEISETSGTCAPCTEGTDYTEYPSGLSFCLPCRRCKPDEEVVSRCTSTRNTVCRCQEGYYCPPEHPCEVCLICTARCPKGKHMVRPCNATADIQCDDRTENSSSLIVGVVVAVVIVVFLIILIYIIFWKKAAVPGRRHSGSESLLWLFQGCPNILTRICGSRRSERDDNEQNRTLETRERRPLLPETGVDLRQSFSIFLNNVPFKQWKTFLRELRVSDNEISVAEQNYHGDVREQQIQLLNSWLDRTGSKASVNTLLDALCKIDLRGVAEKIEDELVQTSQYKYDTED
ncbi:tumor necrosis factor receptor superfamily member 10B isoform X2 [Microcaecilia unicolor]|uniref:Tumor necrosis factor receptor superfamily member 10B-like isoform X2 n=1 Tax=Microcaecilia unicolor TaxID=1415580 RepID=A0A6P7XZ96_9AMPH|nr:tumor necrosis factor receptor superfamily member 10B-like isoform X2 [Microcaecilia unicolor]